MFAFFLIVAGVPLIAVFAAYVFLNGITWKEFLCIIGAMLVVAGSSAGIVSCANTHDTEAWNGVVTGKQQVWVSCSHSYQCNCRQSCTGSGKNQSCSTVCDTCYEHTNDWDWDVYTSNQETITIDRVDRRGSSEPPRFTAVKMGEPTTLTHGYTNYIKAAPGSLFRHQGLKEKYATSLPEYPGEVYDYYRMDRLVTIGLSVNEAKKWNHDLMRINADLGRPKQVNMIVVLVRNKPDDWYYALEESWIGGKKNDAILVVSVDDEMKPQWAQVMAWTTNELFKIKLRDDIMDEKVIDRNSVMTALANNVRLYYVRKPMKDFEYLSSQITPSTTEWVITLIIAFLIAGGLVYFFETQDPFGDEGYSAYARQRRGLNFKFRNPFASSRPWEDV